MKWYTSSPFFAARFPSSTIGSGLANALCAARIFSLFDNANPFNSGGKSAVNCLSSVSVSPIVCSRSFPSASLLPPSSFPNVSTFNNTPKIACVAHAFVITWLAKNKLSGASTFSTANALVASISVLYLNKKINPCKWKRRLSDSRFERSQSSSTWTPLTPICSTREVNTAGSDSIVVHSIFVVARSNVLARFFKYWMTKNPTVWNVLFCVFKCVCICKDLLVHEWEIRFKRLTNDDAFALVVIE